MINLKKIYSFLNKLFKMLKMNIKLKKNKINLKLQKDRKAKTHLNYWMIHCIKLANYKIHLQRKMKILQAKVINRYMKKIKIYK